MKKIFYIFLGIFFGLQKTFASLKDSMMPTSDGVYGGGDSGSGTAANIIIYVKDFLLTILYLIAIGVFLYFGFKLISARGNEEEFKKALMGFVYAIVGLAIIPLALGLVKIISSLDF